MQDYFLYIFKEPGVEFRHLKKIIIETIILIGILIYYIISLNFTEWYYLLFILFYIYEIINFYLIFKDKYYNLKIYKNHNYTKDINFMNTLKISDEDKKEGWILHKYFEERHNFIAMYSEKYNNELIENIASYKITIKKDKHISVLKYIRTHWNTSFKYLQYKLLQSHQKDKDLFNDYKICLGSDITKKNLDIYFGTYFDSIITNEACGTIYEDTRTGKVDAIIPVGCFTNKEYIQSLSASRCNNHIGVSTLAITLDNKIVIWTQNTITQQNSNQLIPTGSGSLDKNDAYINNEQTDLLEKMIISGTNRELCEESSIKEDNIIETKIIGYWRWVERGGKPEFISISQLNIDSCELIPDKKEIKDAGTDNIILIDLDDINLNHKLEEVIKNKKSSLPLVVSITFFINFTKNIQAFTAFKSLTRSKKPSP